MAKVRSAFLCIPLMSIGASGRALEAKVGDRRVLVGVTLADVAVDVPRGLSSADAPSCCVARVLSS